VLVERFLELLLSAAQRSKWGVLFIVVGALILFTLLVSGFVSVAGNTILMMTGAGPVIDFLGSGWGVLVTAVVSIILVFVGIGFLWFLKPHSVQATSGVESEAPLASPSTDPEDVEQLKSHLTDTKRELTKAQQQIHRLQEEKEQLQDRLREAEQTPDEVRAENQRLREKLAKRDADRTAFRGMLIAAHSEGASLRESKPNETDAREWASRVSGLIEAALGDWQVRRFRSDEGVPAPHDLDATPEQNWMYYRLAQLLALIRQLESPANLHIRPGFDPDNESLKRRCREVAEDLFQFLDDHREQNEDDIKELYRRRLRGRVKALLRDLEQQAWWPPETLPSHRRNSVENPLTPYSIGSLADFLNEIGHRQ
jgi:TolA-binding protein